VKVVIRRSFIPGVGAPETIDPPLFVISCHENVTCHSYMPCPVTVLVRPKNNQSSVDRLLNDSGLSTSGLSCASLGVSSNEVRINYN
jgi:hypothetical protein